MDGPRIIGRAAVVLGCVTMAVGTAAANAGATRTAKPVARHIAGYLENGSGNDSVTATLTVPTATCPDADVSFQGTSEGAIAFTDVGNFSSAAVATACFGTSPAYIGIINIDGTATQYPDVVAPGDVVLVTISAGPGGAHATIRDRTRHWFHELATSDPRTATEVGVGAIAFACQTGGCSPAAQLTPTKFKNVTDDADGLGGATSSKFKAVDGSIEMGASKLGPTGETFTARWVSTCDPGAGSLC